MRTVFLEMLEDQTGPPAVVLGLSPTGLHVVRALGRAGVQVTGVADGPAAGLGSRYLAHRIVEPDPQCLLEILLQRFPVPDSPGNRCVLIPTSDKDVEFVIRNAKTLEPHFAFQASYADGLAAEIMDKSCFYALCARYDVAYPALQQTTLAGIGSLRDIIAYPSLVKPARIQDVKTEMAGQKA